MAVLAPFGLSLGMAMPIGLRRLSALYPEGVPWAWGINGIMSVLASVLAIAVAITWGFAAATDPRPCLLRRRARARRVRPLARLLVRG